MWTPTDHWLEITIETLGRWEGWMCTGRAIEKYPLKIFPLCTYGIFFSHQERVVICQIRLLIRIGGWGGVTCQIDLNGAEL